MKKLALLVLLLTICVMITGCACNHEGTTAATCEKASVCGRCGKTIAFALNHEYRLTDSVPSTCTVHGEKIHACVRCGKIQKEEMPLKKHEVEFKTTKKPTLDSYGEQTGVCDVCEQMITSSIPKLGSSKDNPYQITAKTLYSETKSGISERYVGKFLSVSGKIQSISHFSDMNGYYLYGKKGEGVVCWVYEREQSQKIGQQLTFSGYVAVYCGTDQFEVTYCEVEE